MWTKVYKSYKTIEKLSHFSSDKIVEWQNKKIKALINHAYENTVYYRNVFNEKNIRPSDINTHLDLKKLPILTKKTISEGLKILYPIT